MAKWALPVLLGLVFGFWAAANRRYGGPITGWNLLFGWLCALVFVVAYSVVREVARHLRREHHALLWAAFTGCATGFLISQSPYVSLLRAVIPALAAALGVFVMLFYVYYTREDPGGRSVT
jgi:FtsH-binding integral membrane protein